MLEEAKRRVWSMFLVCDKQNYWDKKLSLRRRRLEVVGT